MVFDAFGSQSLFHQLLWLTYTKHLGARTVPVTLTHIPVTLTHIPVTLNHVHQAFGSQSLFLSLTNTKYGHFLAKHNFCRAVTHTHAGMLQPLFTASSNQYLQQGILTLRADTVYVNQLVYVSPMHITAGNSYIAGRHSVRTPPLLRTSNFAHLYHISWHVQRCSCIIALFCTLLTKFLWWHSSELGLTETLHTTYICIHGVW